MSGFRWVCPLLHAYIALIGCVPPKNGQRGLIMLERATRDEYGDLRAEAYKITGDGLIVSFWEKTDVMGRMTCTVAEWDKWGLHDKKVETFTNWEKGLFTYLSWAFGVTITN